MKLRIFRNSIFETIEINEGCCFLLPGGIPHKPVREENSVGIVIESTRRESENGTDVKWLKKYVTNTSKDALVWFCPDCNSIIHKIDFKINRMDKDIECEISNFEKNNVIIQCDNCSKIVSLQEFSVST